MINLKDALFDKMKQGDERCELPIGTKVRKSVFEKGDMTPVGTPGTVEGSFQVHGMDCYLVRFDLHPELVFIIGDKIQKLK